MYPDIFNAVSIISGTSASSVGSFYDISRLTRKSVFISVLTDGSGTSTGSQLFVNVEATPTSGTNAEWYIVDNVRYESGTAVQQDVFSYVSHLPLIRTKVIGSNVGVFECTTTITGRGI